MLRLLKLTGIGIIAIFLIWMIGSFAWGVKNGFDLKKVSQEKMAANENAEEQNGEICTTKERFSAGMALSTVVTVYSLVGYCTKKNPDSESGYNKCVADGIPIMLTGMVKHGLATEEEVQDAKTAGLQGGYRLFTEGTGWLGVP